MAVEGDVQAILAALVANRCYPLVAPDKVAHPYIVFQVISNPTENTMDGDAGISRRRFQVDCWADSYGAAKLLLKGATTAMNEAGHLKMGENPDKYDGETKTFCASVDFSVWGES